MLLFAAVENCGGRYTEESGTIDYPPGDFNYGYNEYCVWHVQLPDSSSRIAVNFTEMELGYDLDCDYEHLKVSIYTYSNILAILLKP